MKNKGFLTIAFGSEEYINLAKNLIKSYRISDNKFPFAIATDSIDKELNQLFDFVIPINIGSNNNYSEKLNIFDYSPFEETIFIDSDCLIIKNLDFIWKEVDINDVSVIGSFPEKKNHFYSSKIAKEKYGVDYQPVLNGGVYYFKKNEIAKSLFEKAKSFIPEYDILKMPKLNGKFNEEPLIALAIATQNIHPIKSKHIMFCTPGQKNFKINVLRNKCSFDKYGVRVKPAIMHFAINYTRGFHYKREVDAITQVFDYKKNKLYTILLTYLKWNPRYIYRIFRMRLREKNYSFFPLTPMLNDKSKLEKIL